MWLLQRNTSPSLSTRMEWLCTANRKPNDNRRDHRYMNVVLKGHHTEVFMRWTLPSCRFGTCLSFRLQARAASKHLMGPRKWSDLNDWDHFIPTNLSDYIHPQEEKKIVSHTKLIRSLDSAVCRATGYGLDDGEVGVRGPVESKIFSSPLRPHRLWVPHSLPFQWVPGALSPGGGGGKAAGARSWPLTSS
jgi:hypothetical protein